jgi:hypothetical protein
MATLVTLPAELQLEVCSYLRSSDVAKVSRTCKHLHDVAIPVLYNDLSIQWSYLHIFQKRDHAPSRAAGLLLRNLLEDDTRRLLVKKLEFRATNFENSQGVVEKGYAALIGYKGIENGLRRLRQGYEVVCRRLMRCLPLAMSPR